MEVFTTTLACADTALRTVSSIKQKYEAYKKSTTLLRSVREKLEMFQETLSRGEEKIEMSDTACGVLARIQSNFDALNIELEEVHHRLSVKSKVEKWFSSGKDVASFESIAAHLNTLEKHFDMWAMVVDVTQKILPELRNISNLIFHLMRNSDGYRDDQKRVLHMLSTSLATRPIQQFVQHPNPQFRRAIEICENPRFGHDLRYPRVFSALTDNVPKLMHKLSDKGANLGDQHELLERLQKFWDTCTITEINSHHDGTHDQKDVELDIDALLVRLDSIHKEIETSKLRKSNSSRPKSRWLYTDKDGRHSMDDPDEVHREHRRAQNRAQIRHGETQRGLVEDRAKNGNECYALVPWNGRDDGNLHALDDRHRKNEESDQHRQHQKRMDTIDDREKKSSFRSRNRSRRREDETLNGLNEDVDEVCHSWNEQDDGDVHSFDGRHRKDEENDRNRQRQKRLDSTSRRKKKSSSRSRNRSRRREDETLNGHNETVDEVCHSRNER